MTVEAKARRYLAEGRLTIRYAELREIAATCQGSAPEPYELGWTEWAGWECSCPARTRGCTHLTALRLVVDLAELKVVQHPKDKEHAHGGGWAYHDQDQG